MPPPRVNITSSSINPVYQNLSGFTSGGHTDAFGRLRVSSTETLFDSKQLYDKAPLYWDEKVLNGTAVHQPNDAATLLSVPANNGDFVVRQTKMRFHYQPGKSQFILMTGTISAQASVTKRIGAILSDITTPFAPSEGMCFETDGTDHYVTIYKGGIGDTIVQGDWDDPMDGTGPSGMIVDWTAPQIFYIDYQWLGVGTVRFGLIINGLVIIVHSLHHANIAFYTTTYTKDSNLPLQYSIRSTGGAGSMQQICSVVSSEGHSDQTGLLRSINMQATLQIAIGLAERRCLLAVRIKPNRIGTFAQVKSISGIGATADNLRFFLSENPTIANFDPSIASWVDVPNSSLQFFRMAANNTIADEAGEGTVLWETYSSGQTRQVTFNLDSFFRLGSSIDGVPTYWVLSCQSLTAGGQASGSILFQERD